MLILFYVYYYYGVQMIELVCSLTITTITAVTFCMTNGNMKVRWLMDLEMNMIMILIWISQFINHPNQIKMNDINTSTKDKNNSETKSMTLGFTYLHYTKFNNNNNDGRKQNGGK